MLKLTKKTINRESVPYLTEGRRGPSCKAGLWRIVRAVSYRLRTGTQWRELPMRELFGRITITWQAVYYHFNKWCKDGSWECLWTAYLKAHRPQLDMSSVQLDGSQTPAKNGGQAVDYQGRKKCRTTNMLFLTDSQGIPLACSQPVMGNHNDLFEVEKSMSKIIGALQDADIEHQGLFLNADAGFDSDKMRKFCQGLEISPNIAISKRRSADHDYLLDDELYQDRFVVERTNAWLDGFKSLIVRYETKAHNWASLHYLAFSLILLRRVTQS